MIIVRSQSAAAPKAIIICQRNDLLLKKMSVESSFLCSFASRCQLIKITFIEKSSSNRAVYIRLGFFLTPFSISNFVPSSFTLRVRPLYRERNQFVMFYYTHTLEFKHVSRGGM